MAGAGPIGIQAKDSLSSASELLDENGNPLDGTNFPPQSSRRCLQPHLLRTFDNHRPASERMAVGRINS
jgi:hypothetical protein